MGASYLLIEVLMDNLIHLLLVNRPLPSVAYKQQANSSLERAAATESVANFRTGQPAFRRPLLIGNARRNTPCFGSPRWQNASKATQSSILPWACRPIRGGKQDLRLPWMTD